MTTKVKKLEYRKGNEVGMVKVILEKNGKEYIFGEKVGTVMDEDKFAALLKMWDEEIIPQREADAKVKEEDIEKVLKKRAKMESKG